MNPVMGKAAKYQLFWLNSATLYEPSLLQKPRVQTQIKQHLPFQSFRRRLRNNHQARSVVSVIDACAWWMVAEGTGA